MREEWHITRGRPACSACQRPLEAGKTYLSTLVTDEAQPSGFRRVDYCEACRAALPAPEAGQSRYWWRTRVPAPETAARPRFDLEMARNLLQRLEGAVEPRRLNLRYLLALYLMRRRRLVFEDRSVRDGQAYMRGRLTGIDETVEILEPEMDEEARRIAQEDLLALFDDPGPDATPERADTDPVIERA